LCVAPSAELRATFEQLRECSASNGDDVQSFSGKVRPDGVLKVHVRQRWAPLPARFIFDINKEKTRAERTAA
jgi:hypothetical protein